jgi:hypothetical protein
MEEKTSKEIEEAFELLDKLKKGFKDVESKSPPCIGNCNDDCGTVDLTERKVTNFYTNNV